MAGENSRLWKQPQLWVEIFALANIGLLTFDIYLAHSVNQFRNRAEYLPLFVSAIAPLLLAAGLTQYRQRGFLWRYLGHMVGWVAVATGVCGVVFHLESHFFYERTIRSLTYSAPFAAPLAYTGIGLLLVMNRMVDPESKEWAQWVFLLTLGGFVGNYIFSLTDHAGNGFFFPVEWVPVIASAIAVGFLVTPLVLKVSRRFILICGGVLACEAGVGAWGFLLHAAGNLRGPSTHAFDNFIYGAPPLAPLLFPNLAVLGFIGVWKTMRSA